MKLFENTCEFQYPWDQVTAANWRKYPNEMSTHVVAVDVLRRELDTSHQILTTERLITCKQSIPSWLQYIVGCNNVSYVREVSTVDLPNKTLTLRSVNLTMSNLLKVFETVTYTPDTADPSKTVFKQEARITAYAALQRVCNKIEEWSVQRFGENAKKGRAGFEGVLKMFNEQWEKREKLVDELSQELSEGLDKVVKTVDTSLDKVKEISFETVREISEKVDLDKVKTELVKETDKIFTEAELKAELVKKSIAEETGKILTEAESVKKSIVHQYYDMIKKAFKRD